jgi:hypothetical protein
MERLRVFFTLLLVGPNVKKNDIAYLVKHK